jgi:hypothetical protein
MQAREELLREGRHPPRISLLTKLACPNGNSWDYRADLITNYGRRFLRGHS